MSLESRMVEKYRRRLEANDQRRERLEIDLEDAVAQKSWRDVSAFASDLASLADNNRLDQDRLAEAQEWLAEELSDQAAAE